MQTLFLLVLINGILASDLAFNLTKNECVKKCHDPELIEKSTIDCEKSQDLMCKAQHKCAEKSQKCGCEISFFCQKKSGSDKIEENLSNDYSIDTGADNQKNLNETLKKAIKKIAKGGHRNFLISTQPDEQKGCQPLCESVSVTNGCEYGHSCKVKSEYYSVFVNFLSVHS